MMVFANTLGKTMIVKFLALKKWVEEGANIAPKTPPAKFLPSYALSYAPAARDPEHDLKNTWDQSAI